MNWRHAVIFVGWSAVVMIATGIALFVFSYGDCFDDEACRSVINRNFWIIAGSAFVIYWAVALALFRRWSR